MSKTAMVTGAGAGLGLEMVRQLLERGYDLVASPRASGSTGLAELMGSHPGRLQIVPMDVNDPISVAGARKQIESKTGAIDLLINNAAVYPHAGNSIESLDLEGVRQGFDVNAIGILRVVQTFLPLLRAGAEKRILLITSLMGSIADNGSGGSYAYRISKTAVNMIAKNLSHDLGGEGFFTLAIHPGWVRTKMGGDHAPMGVTDSVNQILANGLDSDRGISGGFRGPGGKTLPY